MSPLEEIERRLARIEEKLDENLRLQRKRINPGEAGPPPPPKFRRAGDRWEVWCGEGCGWSEWFGPEPSKWIGSDQKGGNQP